MIIKTEEQLKGFAQCFAGKKIYGVPNSGKVMAYYMKSLVPTITVVLDPSDADVIVDDVIDSGTTYERYASAYPHVPFTAFCDKREMAEQEWVGMPWEDEGKDMKSADDIVTRLLQFMGEDSTREGLLETPKRFLKAWKHYTSGYGMKPEDVMKCFEDGAENCDQMVVVRNIPIYSHCEHHIAPIIGTAIIGYIPDGKIVGLSKLARLANVFARRLQVQERLTNQIAGALNEAISPLGCGVIIQARHMCMEMRGVEVQGSDTVTSALHGMFKDDPTVRAEFMALKSP